MRKVFWRNLILKWIEPKSSSSLILLWNKPICWCEASLKLSTSILRVVLLCAVAAFQVALSLLFVICVCFFYFIFMYKFLTFSVLKFRVNFNFSFWNLILIKFDFLNWWQYIYSYCIIYNYHYIVDLKYINFLYQ